MVRALFDTNILIDYLNAVPEAGVELARYDQPAISIVTWMEVMVGVPTGAEAETRRFLDGFMLVPLDARVAQQTIELRRKHRIKLPDAIVWASAQVESLLLVTRNIKDFPEDDPSIRMPYRI